MFSVMIRDRPQELVRTLGVEEVSLSIRGDCELIYCQEEAESIAPLAVLTAQQQGKSSFRNRTVSGMSLQSGIH